MGSLLPLKPGVCRR